MTLNQVTEKRWMENNKLTRKQKESWSSSKCQRRQKASLVWNFFLWFCRNGFLFPFIIGLHWFWIPVPWSRWRRACCRGRPSIPAGDWRTGSGNGWACWWRPSWGTSGSSSSGSADTRQRRDTSALTAKRQQKRINWTAGFTLDNTSKASKKRKMKK